MRKLVAFLLDQRLGLKLGKGQPSKPCRARESGTFVEHAVQIDAALPAKLSPYPYE